MNQSHAQNGVLKWSLRLMALLAAMAIMGLMLGSPVGATEEFAEPSLLITTEQLEGLLNDLDVRIIDLRDPAKYQEGHIPFALSLPAAAVLDSASRIAGARRGDAELAQMFGQLGIGSESQVVLYDDAGGHEAARVLWILRYFGHQNVSLVDGGFPKWQDDGRHITQQTTLVTQKYFPLDLVPRRLATADWILDHLGDPSVVIVDVRQPERYAESHVPGAINIPWRNNLDADETWKNPDELREMYESAGVTKDDDIVVYCQGGNHNGHTYLTLKALGYPQVRSYDRAWPEWGSDPSLPKVTGDSPGAVAAGDLSEGQATTPPRLAEQPLSAGENSGEFNWAWVLIGGLVVVLLIIGGAVIWRISQRQARAG